MKLLLTFVICFTVALAAPADKQKRDILPGDPRYGTEHHPHHHEQNPQENEVQVLKAAGGYVGSFTVPDDTVDHSLQVQSEQYGPPNHTPGKPLGSEPFVTGDEKISVPLQVPATSYGIPDITQIGISNLLSPISDDKKSSLLKTTLPEEPKFDIVHTQKTVIPEIHHEVHNVQQPAVLHKHVDTVPQTVTLPRVKVTTSHVPTEIQGKTLYTYPTSYAYPTYNIPIKTVDHHVRVHVPHPYQVPVTKHVAYPVAVPQTVEVPKPYYVRVPQPVQVTVDRPYPVEVPRPVPYPVPHYVKTSVPATHSHHITTLDTKAIPFQGFFDNTQTSFQNVFGNLPTFGNPLEGFSNPFENLDLSSIPGISSLPFPLPPFFPSQGQNTDTAPIHVESSPAVATNSDTVTVENPALKSETTVTKTSVVQPIAHHTKTSSQVYKPSTACAGCTVTAASNKQEYVQATDANGGYVY
ncbi:uncharacterized protein LOC105423045 isoform X2 [Pogonomyrmex barbatus]|uniref:Uncharacterized protein LOC105423045 isoform X2 n=1 Tax=Pogonomyrmex barbatus TaxID=144034 RepID=A0A6I9VQE4_9HYME|nr:uncharacterized protein LOC105423045 isoform X2 [Pogonomyrmex barbatus]